MSWHDFGIAAQWPGYVLGLTGVLMTTVRGRRLRQIGFAAAALSDVAWGLYGIAIASVALVAMQVTYGVICCLGIWNNRK